MQDYIEMVKAAAKQHRLELSEAEIAKFARDVPDVLSLFSKLDEFNGDLLPSNTIVRPESLRVDEVRASKFDAFSNASEKLTEKGFFVAPRIKKQG